MGHWCNGSIADSKPVRSEFESLMARHLECRVCQQTKPETEFSWRVRDKIRQCQILCANCHRKKTAAQFGWHSSMLG